MQSLKKLSLKCTIFTNTDIFPPRYSTSGPVSGNITSVGLYEQIYSSPSDREKNKQTKTIYNKHKNTIDIQDYHAVARV